MADLNDLETLAKLKEDGVITEEEFQQQKEAILTKNLKSEETSSRNGILYIILTSLFGLLGVHNFYAGYIGKGAAQLLMTLFSGLFIFIPLLIIFIWNICELLFVNYDAQGKRFSGNRTTILVIKGTIALILLIFFTGSVNGYKAAVERSSARMISTSVVVP